MPYYDMYFILVNIDKDQMNCPWLINITEQEKINQHGGKYNCIETPVTNWRLLLLFTVLTEINEQINLGDLILRI